MGAIGNAVTGMLDGVDEGAITEMAVRAFRVRGAVTAEDIAALGEAVEAGSGVLLYLEDPKPSKETIAAVHEGAVALAERSQATIYLAVTGGRPVELLDGVGVPAATEQLLGPVSPGGR